MEKDKREKLVVLIILLSIIVLGTGYIFRHDALTILGEYKINKYLQSEYSGVELEIVESEYTSQGINYVIEDKDKGILFNIDTSRFGNMKDYYKLATNFRKDDFRIRDRYYGEVSDKINKILKKHLNIYEKKEMAVNQGVSATLPEIERGKYSDSTDLKVITEKAEVNLSLACDFKDDNEFIEIAKKISRDIYDLGYINIDDIIISNYGVKYKDNEGRYIFLNKEMLNSNKLSVVKDNLIDKTQELIKDKIEDWSVKDYSIVEKVFGESVIKVQGVVGAESRFRITTKARLKRTDVISKILKVRDEVVKKYPNVKSINIIIHQEIPYYNSLGGKDLERSHPIDFEQFEVTLGNHYTPLNADYKRIDRDIQEMK